MRVSQMSMGYVVSAKKATSVLFSASGSITGPNELNLILAKTNRLEIYAVTTDGLRNVVEVPIFGRIATMNVFRWKNETIDSIVIVTVKQEMAIMCWDMETGKMKNRAFGNISEKVGRPSETGTITTLHINGMIVVRAYDHAIKVIQWDESSSELRAFLVRVEDMPIFDIAFLHPTANDDSLRLAYIYEDSRGRHLKTTTLSVEDRELKNAHITNNIESEATFIIPIPAPYGGCVVLGRETVIYTRHDNKYVSVAPPHMDHSHFTAFAPIDKSFSRVLITDDSGNLFLLVLDLNVDHGLVKDMRLEFLGETSIATSVTYLDNSVVYVGSRFGDSQLIRLSPQHNELGTYINLLDSYPNIGPIRDMVVMESDGLSHIVTCSGGYKDGSLRIIRNGIGIEECAHVDLQGVKALFSLSVNSSPLDDYLVISLAHETHILEICGEELEDTTIEGLETEEATLFCGTIEKGLILQVTPKSIRLSDTISPPLLWTPPSNLPPIGLASVNVKTKQMVVATGAHLFYFEIKQKQIVLIKQTEMEEEISALNISPVVSPGKSTAVAVALWKEMSVVILSLPDLSPSSREILSGDVVIRSIEMVRMDENVYVLCAMGDGTLFYILINPHTLCLGERKKATLGTQPTSLHPFISNGVTNIFACSDRPAVIYSSAGKIVFSNVNLKLVNQVCTLNSETFRDCLVLSDGETLIIGRIDDIQKLHMRCVPLGESPARIAHQPQTGTIAIITHRDDTCNRVSCSRLAATTSTSKPSTSKDEDGEIFSVIVMDANTFEILHAHEFKTTEQALSITSTLLGEDPTPYYVVGSCYVHPEEPEPKLGRLLVFECLRNDQRTALRLVHEKEIKGAPNSLSTLSGKLVACVNSSVRLFEWSMERELKLECSHFNYVNAVTLKTKGDLILVGDLMRSLCLVSYKSMESSIEETARNCSPKWITACEIIHADSFLGAEATYSLFNVEKDTTTVGGEDKQRLIENGSFYLGELVNVFRRGQLVSACVESVTIPISHSIIYGTVEGSIGIVLQLDKPFFQFFNAVEKAVASRVYNCLHNEHKDYRSVSNEKTTVPKMGFIDGDLVESVLDLPRSEALEILQGIQVPGETECKNPEEVLKLIEEMSRMH